MGQCAGGDLAATRTEGPQVLLGTDGPEATMYCAALKHVGLDVVVATSADGLLELCGQLRPDAVVVGADLRAECPGVVGRAHDATPESAIVVMSESERSVDLLWALWAGAVGFVPASIGPRQLARSVQGVLNGEAAVPRSLVRSLAEGFRDRPHGVRVDLGDQGPAVVLSDREWAVLCLLRQKLSTREIAETLFISQVTVRSHVFALGAKLGSGSRQSMIELFEPITG